MHLVGKMLLVIFYLNFPLQFLLSKTVLEGRKYTLMYHPTYMKLCSCFCIHPVFEQIRIDINKLIYAYVVTWSLSVHSVITTVIAYIKPWQNS